MKKEQWNSKLGFILAAAGSAIGLGAVWKFPYMAGTNGGGIFFLLFLLFTLLIGMPMLLAEFVIGKATGKNAISAFKQLAPRSLWYGIGYLGVIASFILLSFYSVVGGWIILYLIRSASGRLSNLPTESYGQLFDSIIESPLEATIAQFSFILLTILVVQGGIQKGIERASRVMMPALFLLFIILVFRSLTLDGAIEGVKFFLQPNVGEVTKETVFLALGQSLFSLSLGISIMVTYSSYLPKKENIVKSASWIVTLNIVISLLAGLAIFPAVFSLGFEPDTGPGLIFVVIPAVFNEIAFGGLFLTTFLLLLLFATLTSSFSILEIIVAALIKEQQEKRKVATWIGGIIIFIVGIPSALSFGMLKDIKVFNKTIFDLADYFVSNISLPVGSLLISLFVGYQVSRPILEKSFNVSSQVGNYLFRFWYVSVRFLIPLGIFLVLFLGA
ncbi:sodium-dependent transporter [Cytobacillus sp. IB215665]|uniref:sodium-dependent transporter n=1 Tax=Cytobacillus sp. IB215665 TaxID=3097357 RepID=UPI002A14B7D5|nr:sodium-dependent transporter [Cytobacillus sp. IB215665]MDX8363870.1 sodium-dependent transporter [Cytobacillus sp. IB215665]